MFWSARTVHCRFIRGDGDVVPENTTANVTPSSPLGQCAVDTFTNPACAVNALIGPPRFRGTVPGPACEVKLTGASTEPPNWLQISHGHNRHRVLTARGHSSRYDRVAADGLGCDGRHF